MAVADRIVYEDESSAIIELYSDAGAAESAVNKVDVSADFTGTAPSELIIERIDKQVHGMSVALLWDATANVPAIILSPGDQPWHHCNDAPLENYAGAGKTGDLLLTTIGETAGASSYWLRLFVRKVF